MLGTQSTLPMRRPAEEVGVRVIYPSVHLGATVANVFFFFFFWGGDAQLCSHGMSTGNTLKSIIGYISMIRVHVCVYVGVGWWEIEVWDLFLASTMVMAVFIVPISIRLIDTVHSNIHTNNHHHHQYTSIFSTQPLVFCTFLKIYSLGSKSSI